MAPTAHKTDYAPDSSFGWLDYDEASARRMREILEAFKEKDTIDAFGVGVVRDAFADQLFPGTSTIQTRARYFFGVPWSYMMCENKKLPPRELQKRIRELEIQLIESLRAGVSVIRGSGIIGGIARKHTKRLASSVYWNGLGQFRIRKVDLSPSELRGLIPQQRRRLRSSEHDDNGEAVVRAPTFWANDLPAPPRGFPTKKITPDLQRGEARYLADAIQTGASGTLLALLARAPELAVDLSFPWELESEGLPPDIERTLMHARCFSEVVQGSSFMYNIMLCEAAQNAGFNPEHADPDGQRASLAAWVAMVSERHKELREWVASISEFWNVVEKDGPIARPTKQFVEWWAERATRDPATVLDDPAVRTRLQDRERRIKSPPRLTNKRALERWNGQSFGSNQLSYRFPVVRRLMGDIADGLKRPGDTDASP